MGESYFGGKGAAGVVQQIINRIPPHDVLLVPFAGHCALTRKMLPSQQTVLCDLDPDVIDWWIGRAPPNSSLRLTDGLEFLQSMPVHPTDYWHNGRVVIYCDPPYRMLTRTSATRYRFDWDDKTHQRFLQAVSRLHASKYSIMISHYANALYDEHLNEWHKADFTAMTRGGPRVERLYWNYEVTDLHDFRFYCGTSSKQTSPRRQREVMKRREQSARRKILAMAPLERKRFLRSLVAEFGDGSSSER